MRLLFLAFVLLFASGCDTDGLADRTYPEAGGFLEISVSALDSADPGQYNVRAYVFDVSVCPADAPPNVDCAPDSITLLQTNTSEVQVGVTLYPNQVLQFREGGRYLMSVEVAPPAERPVWSRVTLLGYDRL